MTDLHALLEDQLKDLYSAEMQLTKALPKMAKKAESQELRQAFEQHLEETEHQIERLQQIAEELGLRLSGKKCHAMEGLIEEGKEILNMKGSGAVLDAGLIAAAQRVEHYEIAAYGTARSIANHLGLQQAADTLQEILDEEGKTDKLLTQIAIEHVLPSVPEADDEGAERERQHDQDDLRGTSGEGNRGRSGGRTMAAGRTASAGRGSRSSARSTASGPGGGSRSGGRSSGARGGSRR